MYGQAISTDSRSAISSRALVSGRTRSGKPDGRTTDRCGPDRARASHSAAQANGKASKTNATCGRYGSISSASADLALSSESKSHLRAPLAERTRVCRKCQEEKPYSEFYVNSKGNRRRSCKECYRDASRAQKRENPSKTSAIQKAWRDKKRGHALTNVAKHRAKTRGLPFNLDPKDIQKRVDAGVCELTGIAFDLATPHAWNAPSLDQIAPGKGYITSNVRVVLYALNVMANTWGHQRILEIANAILERRRDRSNELSRALAKRLRAVTEQYGSTMYALTWSEHITPSGHVIPRCRASAARTSASGFIGWPTPTTRDHKDGASEGTVPVNALLGRAAWLAG